MTGALGILRLPSDVRFGYGVRAGIATATAAIGRRAFVVADPFLATTPAFAETVEALEAAGVATHIHTEVPPELPVPVVHDAGRAAARFGPDVVIGYGGGSALDAAKLVALLVSHGGDLDGYYGENAVPGPVVPLVAVPTTAGTGSEVTPVAVVSDPDRELKVGISSPHLIPRAAFVDPELTLGAPPSVTAHAGIDAFVHAVESFTAAALPVDLGGALPVFVGRNALTDVLSLEAAGLIHSALPAALADPGDRGARADMAHGSLLAGMAFGAAGTHLSHAIQYPVGAMTHTPHGLGTGTLLPYVLQACLPATVPRLARLGDALGLPAEDDPARRAQGTVDAIAALCARVDLPGSLADLGIRPQDAPGIVDLTLQVRRLVQIAPVTADATFLRRIVDAAIAGDRAALADNPPTKA
ncbi:iron-containing alcohol dehydrogenase [Microbacterium thalassium]|uniref:Alcohol dehydrogenase n=1 Tax=Microbacterium thalassium TaxID=362649 RepID=A0A7X0FNF9_9MICO|nr:iron-containing alcohol dehydrogenase [Microbacterium thalassium]MBB6390651.1 alcohol dehydrogenase [Microbacterium thalassium]GLK25760.1 alcohol dehydrogenase [Microbacterium thalassium]